MTIRREILQAARRAQNLLDDSCHQVIEFITRQLHADGGFKGRSDKSDLYYTVFGIESLLALGAKLPLESIVGYLHHWGDGESLDLVHLSCLARCWANLPEGILETKVRDRMSARLKKYRSKDGGFSDRISGAYGTVYGAFLALGAYQDLKQQLPDARGVMRSLAALKIPPGGYANQRDAMAALTPASAAAAIILTQLAEPVDPSLSEWLLQQHHRQGGFLAAAAAPIPDLLSTATALHALAILKAPLDSIRQPCLDFIDGLWSEKGGFCANAFDNTIDCEYVFYGLLALGHLDDSK